jgi:hypothetical protein
MQIMRPTPKWFEQPLPKSTSLVRYHMFTPDYYHFLHNSERVGVGIMLTDSLFFVTFNANDYLPSELDIGEMCYYEVNDLRDPVLTHMRWGFFISRYDEKTSTRINKHRLEKLVEEKLRGDPDGRTDTVVPDSFVYGNPVLWSTLPCVHHNEEGVLFIKEGRGQYFSFDVLKNAENKPPSKKKYKVGYPKDETSQNRGNQAGLICSFAYINFTQECQYFIETPKGTFSVGQMNYGGVPNPEKAYEVLLTWLSTDA